MSNDLSIATDELNRLLSLAQDAIASKRFGVSAYVSLIDGSDGCESLGWTKVGDRWALVIVFAGDQTPLLSAPRRVRAMAAHALDRLHEALIQESRVHLADVCSANMKAYAFIRSITEAAQ